MYKELEELKNITSNKIEYIKKQPEIDWIYLKYYEGVLNLITRLEAIDNANPSKALECVDVLKEDGIITTLYQGKALETIRQALLKAQEQEKEISKNFLTLFNLMNQKRFDVKRFKWAFPSREAYNTSIQERDRSWGDKDNTHWDSTLNEEQWELLSKYFGE